jgi:hypothetical protein
MARDGIEAKVPGMGEKNGWLNQMLGIVPPAYWCQVTGRAPAELFQAVEKSEWKLVLQLGWAEAARRHRDADWIESYLKLPHQHNAWHSVVGHLSTLPVERQESLLIRWFLDGHDSRELAFTASLNTSHAWGLELARTFLDAIRDGLGSGERQIEPASLYGLKAAATRIPVSLLQETTQLFEITDSTWPPYVVQALGEFLDFLRFRHEMLTELST